MTRRRRLHAGNFNFADAKEDGSDLRFVAAADATPLAYHIEKYDGLVEEVGLIWVNVATLEPGAATSIWMYYGNDKAPSATDAAGTYDGEEVLVWHFGEADGIARDQTRNHNDALTAGVRDEAGLISWGLSLDGTAPVHLPASPSRAIAPGQPLTWSVWIKPAGAEQTSVVYEARGVGGAFRVGLVAGMSYAEIETPSGRIRTRTGELLAADVWHHVAVTVADRTVVYVDGARYGDAEAVLPQLEGEALLGGSLSAPIAPITPAGGNATPAAANATQAAAGTPVVAPGFTGQTQLPVHLHPARGSHQCLCRCRLHR
ncbi:MAG: DUF2341 domain-containing protein [Rhodospirillales bacterium]|nr:DUF2341 domain-containing protein [Rhodospirillales bacterium]